MAGGPPTVTAGAQSTSASLVSGNDSRGIITFTTVTVPALGALAALTFFQPYSVAPVVLLQLVTTAVVLTMSATSVTATGFTIAANVAPIGTQAFNVAYAVIP